VRTSPASIHPDAPDSPNWIANRIREDCPTLETAGFRPRALPPAQIEPVHLRIDCQRTSFLRSYAEHVQIVAIKTNESLSPAGFILGQYFLKLFQLKGFTK
jgi:hypothetical protein